MKRHIALFLAAFTLLGLLAGCSGGTQPGGDEPGQQGGADPSGSQTADKETLVTIINNDPGTFNPCISTKSTEKVFLDGGIFEPLFYVDTANNSEWIPALAESYDVSEDGLTYTFNLRQGVKFHNGDDFTAQDVLFTYVDQCYDSPYRSSNFAGIPKEGITAPDDYTIQIALDAPNAALLANLSTISIIPKDYFTAQGEEGFNAAPVGTGAYTMESYTAGDRIVLKAFDGYWGGEVQLKEVVIRIIPDDNTIAIALENGEAHLYDGLATALYSTLSQNESLTIQQRETSTLNYIYINTEKAPWDNAKLRQAVCYAIDRDYLIQAAQSGFGQPTGRLNLPSLVDSPADSFAYTYDLEKAKALVEESGLGTPIDGGTLLCPSSYKNTATVLQQMLAAIGVNVELEIPEGNAFVANSQKGDFSIGTVANSMTGHINALSVLLTTSAIGSYNFARYSNPDVDALFIEALQAPDEAQRQALYKELFDTVQSDAPYCPLFAKVNLIAHNSGLTVPIISDSTILFKNVSWN